MAKVYGVRKGRETGVFETWDKCLKATKRYPGAEYRSFKDEDEAQSWVDGNLEIELHRDIVAPSTNDTVNVFAEGIFVDGQALIGVILQFSDKTYEYSAICTDGDYLKSGAIYAKMSGMLAGVKLACDTDCKTVNVYTNYDGLLSWLSGVWVCKSTMTFLFKEGVKRTIKKSGKVVNIYKLNGTKDTTYKLANKLAKGALNRDKRFSFKNVIQEEK